MSAFIRRCLAATIWLIAPAQTGAHADSIISITLERNGVSAAPARVHPGKITLKVINKSGASGREILVLRMKDDGTGLLMRESRSGDRDYTAHAVGRIASVASKKTSTATVELNPGTYIVTGGNRGPYLNGMWAAFKVE